ncbi:MAG: hypothetical protein K2X62_09215 [Beijerinckiaceae bacterium]|jgi:enamine deaminase RidA (YjgF/YER057c/UK114 family)|nr:hypothetical protein [Beijerinckiaceae bacterium]
MTRRQTEMIARDWSSLAGRDMFNVSVTGDGQGAPEEETGRVIARAIAEIEAAGFSREHIVRSRLFAQDKDMRTRASDCRRALLVGPLRGSSSSFCDAERLPGHARMSLDLAAIRPRDPHARKVVREYEPAIAPPMFVALDKLVFLSGLTDTMEHLGDQIPAIAQAIRHSLKQAGSKISAAKRVSVFLAKAEDPRKALAMIAAEFPDLPCPITLTTVDGYSAPEKRIEIEVTAAVIEGV